MPPARGRMSRSEVFTVHVLTSDDRVREAARALNSDRFQVTFSTNREQALSLTHEKGCDVAVIDLEGGGFGTTRDLHARESTKHTRVVMLCDRPHDRWLCFQAGATAVIVKPLPDVLTLTAAIESIS